MAKLPPTRVLAADGSLEWRVTWDEYRAVQDPRASGTSVELPYRMRFEHPTRGIDTLVCLTCGAEQFFEHEIPANLRCTRCQSTVFRAFDTPTARDEATIALHEKGDRRRKIGLHFAAAQAIPRWLRIAASSAGRALAASAVTARYWVTH